MGDEDETRDEDDMGEYVFWMMRYAWEVCMRPCV